MKKLAFCTTLIVCMLLNLIVLSACNHIIVECEELDAGQVKIMSTNLRRISPVDTDNRTWENRKSLVVKIIQQTKPSIIGMQEVTPQQYKYCKKILSNYQSDITYRDNLKQSEGCPIFYHKELYTLINQGTFWLSETPDVMSKDWESEHYRICSYVVLLDNQTHKEFAVLNTHLDNVSATARINSISVILDKIHSLGYPTVIMGDFNATENSKAYKIATEALLDVKYQVENDYVQTATYNNWGQEHNNRTIDYFLITPIGFTVNSYEVITTTYDGNYASDHFPIVTTLTLAD